MSSFMYSGRKIYYEESGSGEPVVLLHGNTVSSLLFSSAVPPFAKKCRMITLGFLGCGRSERIDEWPVDFAVCGEDAL